MGHSMSLLNTIISGLLMIAYQGLDLYKMGVIAHVVLSWLVSFNIINTHNNFVRMAGEFLYRITEPALRRIRRFVPPIAGFDLSPIALFFIIGFLQYVIRSQAAHMGF